MYFYLVIESMQHACLMLVKEINGSSNSVAIEVTTESI